MGEDGLPVVKAADDNGRFMNSSPNVGYTLSMNVQCFADASKHLSINAKSCTGEGSDSSVLTTWLLPRTTIMKWSSTEK